MNNETLPFIPNIKSPCVLRVGQPERIRHTVLKSPAAVFNVVAVYTRTWGGEQVTWKPGKGGLSEPHHSGEQTGQVSLGPGQCGKI